MASKCKTNYVRDEMLITKHYLSVIHKTASYPHMSATLIKQLIDGTLSLEQMYESFAICCQIRVFSIPHLPNRLTLLRQMHSSKRNKQQLINEILVSNPNHLFSYHPVITPEAPENLGAIVTETRQRAKLFKVTIHPPTQLDSMPTNEIDIVLMDDNWQLYSKIAANGPSSHWRCVQPYCRAEAYTLERWLIVTTKHNHAPGDPIVRF